MKEEIEQAISKIVEQEDYLDFDLGKPVPPLEPSEPEEDDFDRSIANQMIISSARSLDILSDDIPNEELIAKVRELIWDEFLPVGMDNEEDVSSWIVSISANVLSDWILKATRY